jgi:hypothetical protein
MPIDLQELMRHQSLDTTMKYYVGKNSDRVSDAVWKAYVTLFGDPEKTDTPEREAVDEEINCDE